MKTLVFLRVRSKRENLNVFITRDKNIYDIYFKKFYLLFPITNCFWRHNCRRQTKRKRYDVDVQCIPQEALVSQNQFFVKSK